MTILRESAQPAVEGRVLFSVENDVDEYAVGTISTDIL